MVRCALSLSLSPSPALRLYRCEGGTRRGMLSAHLCVPVSAKPALRVCEFVRLDLISSLIHGCGSILRIHGCGWRIAAGVKFEIEIEAQYMGVREPKRHSRLPSPPTGSSVAWAESGLAPSVPSPGSAMEQLFPGGSEPVPHGRGAPAAGALRSSWRPRAMGEPAGKSVRTDRTDLAWAWPY